MTEDEFIGVFVLVSPPPRRGFTPDTLRRSTPGLSASGGRTQGILHSKEVT